MIRSKFSNLVATVIAVLLFAAPKAAMACATCYGKSDSKLAEGFNWGIFSLLVVVALVLAGISAFFVHVARRTAALAEMQYASNLSESTEKR